MKFSRILAASKSDRKRAEFLKAALSSRDFFSYLRYLFYRGRYPVSYRLFLRVVVLIELYLLFNKLPGLFFFETSLFIFILYQSRSFLRNISGYFKNIIFYNIQHRSAEAVNKVVGQSLTSLTKISLILSVFVAASFSLIWQNNDLQLLYQIGLIVLLPIETLSSHLWSVIYLEHRFPRSMLAMLVIRIIPLLYLAIAAKPLAVAYIGLMLLSRISEKAYLGLVAYHYLNNQNYALKLRFFSDNFNALIFKNPLFFKYLCFACCIPCYELGLGSILYVRDKNYWLIYLSFSLFIGLLSFFSLLPARAQLFDIFHSIRKVLIDAAVFLWHRIFISTLVLSASMAILIVLLSVFAADTILIPYKFYTVILYLAVLLVLYSSLLACLAVIQSLALERFFYKAKLRIFSIAILIQFLAMLVLRGNLQLCLLIQCLTFLTAILLLNPLKYFEYSSFYRHASRNKYSKNIFSPASWQKIAQNVLTNKTHSLWIGELSQSQDSNLVILRAIADKKIAAVRLYSKIFLMLIPQNSVTPIFFRWLQPLKSDNTEIITRQICSAIKKNASAYGRTLKLIKRLNIHSELDADTNISSQLLNALNAVTIKKHSIVGATVKQKNILHKDYILGTNHLPLISIGSGFACIYKSSFEVVFYDLRGLETDLTEKIKYLSIIFSIKNFIDSLAASPDFIRVRDSISAGVYLSRMEQDQR